MVPVDEEEEDAADKEDSKYNLVVVVETLDVLCVEHLFREAVEDESGEAVSRKNLMRGHHASRKMMKFGEVQRICFKSKAAELIFYFGVSQCEG